MLTDGDKLGDLLGLKDGLVEGDLEGEVLGDLLGLDDGLVEGDLEGEALGDKLGLVVGARVNNIMKSSAPSSIDRIFVVSPMLATSATTLLFSSKSETVAFVKRSVQQSERFHTTTRLICMRAFIFTIHHGSSEFVCVCAMYWQTDGSSIVPVFPSLA